MAYPYLHHRDFIAHRLNYHACPLGRDLPEDRRECGMCLGRIEDDSRVARVCPTAPDQHTCHWLCMIKWLTTCVVGPDDDFARTCPTCRAALFTAIEDMDGLDPPKPIVLAYRETIARGWDELLDAAGHVYSGPGLPYVDRPPAGAPGGVNPGRSLAYLAHGSAHDFILTVSLLASLPQVEILRSGAFMTDNKVALCNMLHFLNRRRIDLGLSELDFPDDDADDSDDETSSVTTLGGTPVISTTTGRGDLEF